jgi:hypothetical protein
MGLCGKNGRDVCYLGMFDSYPGRWLRFLVKCAEEQTFARKIIKRGSLERTAA